MRNPPAGQFLLEMHQACGLIMELAQVPCETFQSDPIQVSAMLWQFNVLGEAVRRLQEIGFADGHPEIPWKDMRADCDRIVHGHSSGDVALMRDVSLREMPGVRSQLERLPELQEILRESRRISTENAEVILTGSHEPQVQEKILRMQVETLIRMGVVDPIEDGRWNSLTIPELVGIVQSVSSKNRRLAFQESTECLSRISPPRILAG